MADMYGQLTGKPAVLMGQGPFIASSGGFGILTEYESPQLIDPSRQEIVQIDIDPRNAVWVSIPRGDKPDRRFKDGPEPARGRDEGEGWRQNPRRCREGKKLAQKKTRRRLVRCTGVPLRCFADPAPTKCEGHRRGR